MRTTEVQGPSTEILLWGYGVVLKNLKNSLGSSVEEFSGGVLILLCCRCLLWISQKKLTSSYYEEQLWTANSSKFHGYILSNTDWFIWKCNDTNRKSLLRQRVGSKRFVIAFIFLLYFFSSLQCFWTDSQKLILTCVI